MTVLPGTVALAGGPGQLLLSLQNPTPGENDRFGVSVAVTPNGDLLVGAEEDDTAALRAGSVYRFDAETGDLLLTVSNPDLVVGGFFGRSVASTTDGRIVVGAPGNALGGTQRGGVYTFDGSTGALLLSIPHPEPEAGFNLGSSLATTPQGDLLVGTSTEAYLFDGMTGDLLFKLKDPDPTIDAFGDAVATTPDGDLIVGSHNSTISGDSIGAVYLFDGATGDLLLTLTHHQPLQGASFGVSVASTPDGNILVGSSGDGAKGEPRAGGFHLFDGTTGERLFSVFNPRPTRFDGFGDAVAVTADGNLVVGAFLEDPGVEDAGAAYVYDGITGELLLVIDNPDPGVGDEFGHQLAVTPDGRLLVAAALDDTGAVDSGSVYLFEGVDLQLYCGRPKAAFASVLQGTALSDNLLGTAGDDLIVGREAPDLAVGGPGNDCILGGEGSDLLLGEEGDDEIHGGPGNDGILGGDGIDFLRGDTGADTLIGEQGPNVLLGGPDDDVLLGGPQADVLHGQDGAQDVCVGFGGADTLISCELP